MSISRTARRFAAIAVAATLALALTGCAPEAQAPTPRAEATALEPAPVEATVAPEPVVDAPVVGAIITDAEVAAAEAAGRGVYVTATGERIVIDPAAPAPQIILDEAAASGAGAAPAPNRGGNEAAARALYETALSAQAAGKEIVFIVCAGQYGADGQLEKTLYALSTAATELQGPGSHADTLDGALSIAQSRINAQADPTSYEIVVLVS